jgi:hypothetical protein
MELGRNGRSGREAWHERGGGQGQHRRPPLGLGEERGDCRIAAAADELGRFGLVHGERVTVDLEDIAVQFEPRVRPTRPCPG